MKRNDRPLMRAGNNVLVVDGGARGHAIVKRLLASPRVGKVYCAPGNGGTESDATNVDIKVTEVDRLLAFALKNDIHLTVASQDDSLAAGLVDVFQRNGLKIFGPTASAADIEASKAFAKRSMMNAKVPTANFLIISSPNAALAHIKKRGVPVVIKASGLALGKGAYPCRTMEEAEFAIDQVMVQRVHGKAGDRVIVEDYLDGPEVSIQAFCDGANFSLCPSSQDFKREFEGEQGRNTGGLGAIVSVPWFTHNMMQETSDKIVRPIIAQMNKVRRPFVGMLYPGLKVTPDGLQVLEFNARPGDPEWPALSSLLETDLFDIMEACIYGRLSNCPIKWRSAFSVIVVLASGGYPGDYKKGFPIIGIEDAEKISGVTVFHAGTKLVNGTFVTNGGRVLSVNAVRDTLAEAIKVAYQAADCINFEGKYCRRDIGAESLKVMAQA